MGREQYECHICGNEAVAIGIVEGARVHLCPNCVQFGKDVKTPPVNREVAYRSQQPTNQSQLHQKVPAKEIVRDFNAVQGYGDLIKNAREGLNLTRRELANTLFISENVIERLEHESLKPDHKTAQKLEKFLKIKLISEEVPGKVGQMKGELEEMQ